MIAVVINYSCMLHQWLSIKPFSLVFVLLTLSSVINHVIGYDLTISSVDFWECPSFLFLCIPFAILLHLFRAQSTILSFHHTPLRLHIHISNASCRRTSSFCKVHVSLPYNTTIQASTFTIRFCGWRLRDFCTRSLFLLKASFPNAFSSLHNNFYRLQSPDFRGNKIVLPFPGSVI